MNPRTNGTKLIRKSRLRDSGDLKKEETKGAVTRINNAISIHLNIDTIHAELIYFSMSFFSWTRTILIQVSVSISSKDKTKVTMPKSPKSPGARILAKIAVRTIARIRVDPLKAPIHVIPFIATVV